MEIQDNFKGFGEEAKMAENIKSETKKEIQDFIDEVSKNLHLPSFQIASGDSGIKTVNDLLVNMEQFKEIIDQEDDFEELHKMRGFVENIINTYYVFLNSISNINNIALQQQIDRDMNVPKQKLELTSIPEIWTEHFVENEVMKLELLNNSLREYLEVRQST